MVSARVRLRLLLRMMMMKKMKRMQSARDVCLYSSRVVSGLGSLDHVVIVVVRVTALPVVFVFMFVCSV